MCPRPVVLVAVLVACTATLAAQVHTRHDAPATSADERALLHAGSDWALIAPHLPDPTTSSAAKLESAADVLRARRFPEDALDYYGYAMERGGDVSVLLNKMGIVRLHHGQCRPHRHGGVGGIAPRP